MEAVLMPKQPTTHAYLNHGRWVADCPGGCNCALRLEPGSDYDCSPIHAKSPTGSCCLAMKSAVIWPDNIAEIEAAVRQRPARNQNWQPGETIALLEAENAEHV